jgi:hypothetical protein
VRRGDNPGFKNFVLAEPSTDGAVFVFTNGDAGARVYDSVLIYATGVSEREAGNPVYRQRL